MRSGPAARGQPAGVRMAASGSSDGASPRHRALFYSSPWQYAREVVGFVRAGLRAGERVFVAVPGDRLDRLRLPLGGQRDLVEYADISALGANPARIIPAIADFAARDGAPICVVGEPIWPSRNRAELREATRHEALTNLAFADGSARILCPYDAASLSPQVLADACRTHPEIATGDGTEPSRAYQGNGESPPGCDSPLASPPAAADRLE